jgi:hypothetical protein
MSFKFLTVAIMLTISPKTVLVFCGLFSTGAPAIQTPTTSTAVFTNAEINLVAVPSDYSDWKTVRNSRAVVHSDTSPVLLELVPVSGVQDHPYFMKLSNPAGGVHNRWEIRYLRDGSFQVASFVIGQSTASVAVNVAVPVNLTAVDAPTSGVHSYVIQIRYVGDTADNPSVKLEISHARLVANNF